MTEKDKMKTFDLIRNNFAIAGLDSPQSTREDLLKIKNILSFLLFALSAFSSGVYVYYDASNFEEYIDAVFMLTGLSITLFIFANLLWDMPTLYKFIDHLEGIIENRK